MPRVRLPIFHTRPHHPTTSAPAVTPGSKPNPWDPVPKPGSGPYTPDGNAIYFESSGFEELKDRAIISATIEFLDCGPLPPPLLVPAPTPVAAAHPLSPPATASSSSASSSRSSSISFTPINPRVPTPPTSPDTSTNLASHPIPACACCSAAGRSSASDTDSDDSDSSPEYVEPTSSSSSSSRKRRHGGDKPFRPRKRANHHQQPQHRNHVVLRLQTRGTVDLSLPGSRKQPNCCGVVVSVEESASEDDRCYVACKPISYSGVTRSAAAAFAFDVLGQGGLMRRKGEKEKRREFTLRDVLRICEEGGLLPFQYASVGMVNGGVALEVGCRDWMTQLFCRLHQAGYVSWHASDVYPENLTGKGFPATRGTTSFAHVMRHRYSGIRKQGRRLNPKFPYVEHLPIIPGHFSLEECYDKSEGGRKVRWEEYNGEELGYQSQEHTHDEEGEEGLLRRSSRLAAKANKASSGGEETCSG